MSDLYLDDVLNGRQSLKDLAHEAAREAKEAEKQERCTRAWDLQDNAQEFIDGLGLPEHMTVDVEFEVRTYGIDLFALYWVLDGVRFRARWFTPDKSLIEVNVQSHSWKPVTDMVSLGVALS